MSSEVRDWWVRVPMRDGVEIAARVFAPVDAPGPLPAVLTGDPYRNSGLYRLDRGDEPYATRFDGPALLARNGYVAVTFDIRGSGNSGGGSHEMYSDDERADAVEMIEWAARQSWCDGNVGMWGISFPGVAAWQAASAAPPALKAIIVAGATEDVYGDWARPGGIPRAMFVLGGYAAMMATLNALPPDPAVVGDSWREIWETRLREGAPWSIDLLEHPAEDDHWRARTVRSDPARVRCAVLSIGGWHDWYPTSTLRVLGELHGPRKSIVGDWAHVWPEDGDPGGRIVAPDLYLRWFDQFLKGRDTGILDEPRAQVRIRRPGGGVWWEGDAWPPPEARETELSPDAEGRLRAEAVEEAVLHLDPDPSVGTSAGILGFAAAPDQRDDDARSLCATTEPLEAELVLAGFPRLLLAASSPSADATIRVRLCDVAPDGSSTLIGAGDLDLRYRDSRSSPRPLVPDEEVTATVELSAVGYAVPAGHRLRVALSTADFPNLWPVPLTGPLAIRVGGADGTRIVLPVLDRLVAVDAVTPPAARAEPTYSVERHGDRTVVSSPAVIGPGDVGSTTRFEVSHDLPGVAELVCTSTRVAPTPDGEAEVRVRVVTRSDAERFDSEVELEARLAGDLIAERRWTTAVARHPA